MNNRGIHVIFRDALFLILFCFLMIALIAIANVVLQKTKKTEKHIGTVMVQIHWPNDLDTDVDLWVKAPGDQPVGYSNLGARYFNLLRDDLGRQGDPTPVNQEIAISRGMPAGEYIVNVMLYANHSGILPIPVEVLITVISPDAGSNLIFSKRVLLTFVGQEITVTRFTLDDAGNPSNFNNAFMELRDRG